MSSELRSTSFDSTRGSWLDRLVWSMRVRKVQKQLNGTAECVVDLGCGRTAPLLRCLLDAGHARRAIGVDLDPDLSALPRTLTMIRADLNERLPIPDASADVVLSMAVLEHLTAPQLHLNEVRRILKPGGRLLLTTPSPLGKPVLEFLAFRLGVIDRREIEDHKTYFDTRNLRDMLLTAGFTQAGVNVTTFQMGMNNSATVQG